MDIWDFAEDQNEDSTYDVLYLNLTLNISAQDTYRIYATMVPKIPLFNHYKSELDTGEHKIFIQFEGAEIYNSGINGPYSITITIYNDNGEVMVEDVYSTKSYSYEDFNPNPAVEPVGDKELAIKDNTIQLTTSTFIAIIYELTPQIVFYYTSDDGQTARFRVTYDRVLCFSDDDNNGEYKDSELRYWGDLINSRWSSPKVLMQNFDNFEFDVQTIVDLYDTEGIKIDTKLELVFHYSSLTKAENEDSGRKFDVRIKVLGKPLAGVTHLSLEHHLFDEMGNHWLLPSDGMASNKISFMTDDNSELEHGYYSWKNSFERTEKTGHKAQLEVTYNLVTKKNSDKSTLFINYPYSMDTTELFHDPEVGVIPENAPKIPGEPDPDIIRHNQWFFVYLIVAIVVALIIIGNIYYQKKRRSDY
jgi:hypothetical protein